MRLQAAALGVLLLASAAAAAPAVVLHPDVVDALRPHSAVYLERLGSLSDEELARLEVSLDQKLGAKSRPASRRLLQAPPITDPEARDPQYSATEAGVFEGRPGERPELEGYMPPLGYEEMSPECGKIVNTWVAKCAFAMKGEMSLRKSAREKYGPGSALRFVDEMLTIN